MAELVNFLKSGEVEVSGHVLLERAAEYGCISTKQAAEHFASTLSTSNMDLSGEARESNVSLCFPIPSGICVMAWFNGAWCGDQLGSLNGIYPGKNLRLVKG